jgi:two-component sensor histidine kinase
MNAFWDHLSDLLIGFAYFSIAAAFGVFLARRRDVRAGWATALFLLFIVLSGAMHVLHAWLPATFGVEGLVKGATAVASLAAAAILWMLLPRAIALPARAALQERLRERDAAVGELQAAMATMVEMREHEARQKLLLDELNHRVKNTLASVQSIAAQTLGRAEDLDHARTTFLDRLMALSATHSLLAKRQWGPTSFHELVTATLAPYDRPYAYAGPDLKLEPNTAVTLGMAIHELATNALKHGAWSGEGIVTIEVVEMADGEIQIAWLETRGPRVAAPSQPGFGSRLLQSGVARELGGDVSLDYRREGLVCTIRAQPSERLRLAA